MERVPNGVPTDIWPYGDISPLDNHIRCGGVLTLSIDGREGQYRVRGIQMSGPRDGGVTEVALELVSVPGTLRPKRKLIRTRK